MSNEHVYIGFPKGHTSFTIYGGSIKIRDYRGAFIHTDSVNAKSLRVTFYDTIEEARNRHGDEARKMSESTTHSATYRNLQAPTRKYMGFMRRQDYHFGQQEVPAYIIEQTETSVTIDIDLTGEAISKMIKAAKRPEPSKAKTVPFNKVKPTSKSSAGVVEKAVTRTEQSNVKVAVQRVGAITLSGDLTLRDLKRMGFKIMVTDPAETPFVIDTI